MKSESNHRNGGFTLIDLLLVITINALLVSFTIPIFLTQAQKAKQVEAKNFVGTMNRAQQAYYLEHNNVFADSAHFKKLGIGNTTNTESYVYQIVGGGTGALTVTNQATLIVVNSPLKSYVGGVSVKPRSKNNNAITQSILCEADKPPAHGGMVANSTHVIRLQPDSKPLCPIGASPLK